MVHYTPNKPVKRDAQPPPLISIDRLKGVNVNDYLLLRGKKKFEEVFPDLENVKIEIVFLRGGGREESVVTFSKDNFPSNDISCKNPVCKNGGLSSTTILLLIKNMISGKKIELEERKSCTGDCGWSFKIKISAQFKKTS